MVGKIQIREEIMLRRDSTSGPYTACYTRFWEQNPPLSGYGCATSPLVETVYTTNTLGIGQIAPGSTFGLAVATAYSPQTTTNQAAAGSSSSSGTIAPITVSASSGSNGGSGGLSTSDKIALGCGIPIPLLSLVFGILTWWSTRRKKKKREASRSNTIELN